VQEVITHLKIKNDPSSPFRSIFDEATRQKQETPSVVDPGFYNVVIEN